MHTKKKVILVVSLVLVAVLIWGIYAFVECTKTNERISRIIENPITEDTLETLNYIDQQLSNVSFWGNLFIPLIDEYKNYSAANDQFIQKEAEEISAKISALTPCSSIASEDDYNAMCDQLNSIQQDEASAFGMRVIELVPNYDDYLQYRQDYYTLAETYKQDCTFCGGRGRVKCTSCNGKGSKPVTWYEHGDWGETSYSNYSCTSCDGAGKTDCNFCNYGSVYIFNNSPVGLPMQEVDALPESTITMEEVLLSYLNGDVPSQRYDFIKETSHTLPLLTHEELVSVFAGNYLLEAGIDNFNVPEDLYCYFFETGDSDTTCNLTCLGKRNFAFGGLAYSEGIVKNLRYEIKDGLMCRNNGYDFEIREAMPGYYFAHKEGSKNPMYLYILCDENGEPLHPCS